MPLRMLVAICILGLTFGASVCDGESCSSQDDNTDLVQTRLNGDNKTKDDRKPNATHGVKSNEKSTATHHVRHHESSKSGKVTKSKEATAAKETDDGGSARGGKGRRDRPITYYVDYVDYYYYTPQKWLANMSFTLKGLDYEKITAHGELHFAVLWNIKSEIADGFGVPFENVSIFLTDGDNGFLDVAAVIVAARQSLKAVKPDIGTELLSRINTIPNIDEGKSEAGSQIGFTVKVDRLDGGVADPDKTTVATEPSGRRRRSPATHEPTGSPTSCSGNYLGYGVGEAGAGSYGGQVLEFSCSGESGAVKYPLTGQVVCSDTGEWKPFSSGTATSVNNWGCGAENSCWERPLNADGSAMSTANADSPAGGASYTQTPFPPVAPSASFCAQVGGQSPCCNTGFALKDAGVDVPGGVPCSATGGVFTVTGALTCA